MTCRYVILVKRTNKTIWNNLEVTWREWVLWDLESHPPEVSPVQEVTQTLSPVSLDDPLAPALLAELKQEGSELVTRLVDPSKPPVQDVNTWKKETEQCEKKQLIMCIFLKTNFENQGSSSMRSAPYADGSAMCSSMKQPKPERLVEIDGIPMTVHSADGDRKSTACLTFQYFTIIIKT